MWGIEHHVLVVSRGLFLFFGAFSSLGFPPFVAFDQFCKVISLLGHPHELVFEEFAGCWTLLNPELHKDTRPKKRQRGGHVTYIPWIPL